MMEIIRIFILIDRPRPNRYYAAPSMSPAIERVELFNVGELLAHL